MREASLQFEEQSETRRRRRQARRAGILDRVWRVGMCVESLVTKEVIAGGHGALETEPAGDLLGHRKGWRREVVGWRT